MISSLKVLNTFLRPFKFRAVPLKVDTPRSREVPKLNTLQAAVISLLNNVDEINLVQIGANDGKSNDPLYEIIVAKPHGVKVLMVEPQPELIGILKSNFEALSDVHYFQGAISNKAARMTLYRVKPSLWGHIKGRGVGKPAHHLHSKFASLNEAHVKKHLARYRYIDSGEKIPPEVGLEGIDVPVKTLGGLLASYPAFEQIHVLLIDAEGEDGAIVWDALDLDPRPSVINCEIRHLKEKQLSLLLAKLADNGYAASVENGDLLALHLTHD